MSRDLLEKPQNTKDNSREFDSPSAEEGSSPQKSRGLLHVPSRSSSHKNQSSPTATGLSGATIGDSRDSLGGRSKESRASIMGRRRNGSASSNRSAVDTAQTATTMSPNANPQRKKKGGLLSLFCCSVPDDANVVDNEPGDVPSHKVEKLPPRPTTASRRAQTPEQTSASKLQEKDGPQSQNPADSSRAKRASGATQDQSTLAEESKPSTLIGTAPTVTIDPPLAEAADAGPAREATAKDDDGDTAMTDAVDATEPPVQPVEVDDLPTLPPAPPMPAVPSPPQDSEVGLVAAPEQPQQEWLLPPIQPHLKGRKCLVLDLDETLVHSSFKVAFSLQVATFEFRLLMFATDTTPSRLHYTC